jgi:hypothetical protein
LGPYPLENDNCPKRKNTHHISVSFWGEYSPLADKNKSRATHTEDFCGKKWQSHLVLRENYLKSPYLDNRFQQIAKIWQDS